MFYDDLQCRISRIWALVNLRTAR